MLKITGIIITIIGLALLGLLIMNAKRRDLRGMQSELDLILSSGYADSHEARKILPGVSEGTKVDSSIKVAPKKRALSKEAQEILALVEKERSEERNAPASGPKIESTDILSEKKEQPRKQDGTDILPGKRKPEIASSPDGTDILDRKPKKEQAQTDITGREEKAPDGTDILPKKKSKPGSLDSGTDLLDRQKQKMLEATDMLRRPASKEAGDSTDILPKRRERSESDTDILPKRQERTGEGTDILPRKREVPSESTDAPQKRKVAPDGTDILTKRADIPKKDVSFAWAEETDILQKRKGEGEATVKKHPDSTDVLKK